jgi:hypothetical protein
MDARRSTAPTIDRPHGAGLDAVAGRPSVPRPSQLAKQQSPARRHLCAGPSRDGEFVSSREHPTAADDETSKILS